MINSGAPAGVVVWKSTAEGKLCVLEGLQGVDDVFEIKRGISRADGFPENAHFEMDRRHPKDVVLPDSVANLEAMVVVSRALKDHLEAISAPSVEFLRVAIHNHKRRVASDEYFIVNPLLVIDCIDKGASSVRWNRIDPELISGVSRLVLDPAAIPPQAALFRARHLEPFVMVSDRVAQAVAAGGFTGVRFVDIPSFRG